MIILHKASKKFINICLVCLSVIILAFPIIYKILHVKIQRPYSYIISKPMPSFNLPILGDLQNMVSNDVLNGKISIINFWSSHCKSCVRENSMLLRVAGYLKDQNIQLIGVSNQNDHEFAVAWLNKYNNPYNISLFDSHGKLATELGVQGLPELFIVNQDQKIIYRYSGLITKLAWEKDIRVFLKELYEHTL